MADDLQFAFWEAAIMKQAKNCFWCGLTMVNLLLMSCPIVLFRRAQTTEERLIAVLVLMGCLFFLAVVDAVGIVISDGLAEITHGGMHYGAGIVAARRFGAQVVDPRPYALGSIAATLAKYPALEPLLPAMGYGEQQIHELEATLNAVPADLVLAATPIDLRRVLSSSKPIVRVRYELDEASGPPLRNLVESAVRRPGVVPDVVPLAVDEQSHGHTPPHHGQPAAASGLSAPCRPPRG